MMSRPRENPKKISKNFPPTQFKKSLFQAFFQTNDSIFGMALMKFFGPYIPINTLEALLSDFGDFDFGPETEFSILTETINFQGFLKIAWAENFLRIFLGFPEVYSS